MCWLRTLAKVWKRSTFYVLDQQEQNSIREHSDTVCVMRVPLTCIQKHHTKAPSAFLSQAGAKILKKGDHVTR